MEVHELIRIVHLADAIEVICDETGMTIPDCINRLKGIGGLSTDECEQIKLYHTHELRIQQLLQPENVLPVCWNENCQKWSEDICQSPDKCVEDVSG